MSFLNKEIYIRLLATISCMVMLALPLSAQEEQQDSVFTFRFFTGRDMFIVPIMGNGEELSRMFECVDLCKDKIANHDISLYVDGYCQSNKGTDAQKLHVAKIRSNRVKSELIVRKGLKEDNFVTHNHLGDGNYVMVRFMVNKKDLQPESAKEPDTVITAVPLPVDSVPAEAPEVTPVVAEPEPDDAIEIVTEPEPEVAVAPSQKPDSRFALKTNLLDYVALMPNIEAEWKFADRWSLALEWQGAWYSKSSPHKVYRLSTVIPEVRFWAIERSRWHGMHVGLFGGWGLYDLSNDTKGHEGEGWMAGASVGYMWPISKHLSLDAGIGVGYMRARDKVYEPRDGHFLYQMTKNINYFGPLRAKLSLVWRIPSK